MLISISYNQKIGWVAVIIPHMCHSNSVNVLLYGELGIDWFYIHFRWVYMEQKYNEAFEKTNYTAGFTMATQDVPE